MASARTMVEPAEAALDMQAMPPVDRVLPVGLTASVAPMTGCLDPGTMAPGEIERYGLGAAALAYQRLGYSVLALGAGSKRPHPAFASADGSLAGVHWATCDPAMVDYVWPRDRIAGIGVATGAASRLMVVDLDVKGEHNGTISFTDFLNEHRLGIPLDAPWVNTPSGGYHCWLRLPDEVTLPGRTGILPGVDIKADGGYVAAAPSRVWVESIGGGRVLIPYRMHGCPCWLPDAPEWLLRWVEQTPGTGAGSASDDDPLPGLEVLWQTGLPGGARNVTLHRLACRLFRQFGTGPDGVSAVRAALQPVLAATDMRGFGGGEISRAIDSARRFVAAQVERERAAWSSR